MKIDIDEAALEVARQFTSDTDVQRRAQMQVAIVEAIVKSRQADTMLLLASGSEIARLRRDLASRLEAAVDQQRLMWAVIRSVGGEVSIDLRSLQQQDWSIASMKNDRSPDGNTVILRALLNAAPDTNGDGS